MLQEWNQGGAHRNHLPGGDIHQVHLGDGHILGLGLGVTHQGLVLDEVSGLVDLLVGLGDGVLGLLVGGHVDHVVGHLAIDDLAVGGLDEAEWVDPGEGCQGADQADVGAFRGLDGAHASVVGGVHIAHLHGGAVAGQAAGAQGRETTLVGHAGQRVVLIHELAQLGGSEELLDGGVDRADVDQGLRGDGLRVLGGHPLADHALHTAQAGAQLVLDQLAHLTDAAVAEVVDVVHVHPQLDVLAVAAAREGLPAGMQGHQVLQGGDDVLGMQAAVVEVGLKTQLAVDLVAADPGQVVALGVEVEGVQQVAAGLGRGCVRGPDLAVEVGQGLVLGLDGLLLQGVQHQRIALEGLADLRLGHADGHEEDDGGLLALAVHAHTQHIALVDLELQPGAPAGDDLGPEDLLVGVAVLGTVEVDAGRADQLGDDDALRAADDEGAVGGLQREVAHEDGLRLDLAGVPVLELSVHVQGGGVGVVLLLALLDRVPGLLEVGIGEGQAHGLREVLDGRDLLEDLIQAGDGGHGMGPVDPILLDTLLPTVIADQPVEAIGLHAQEVGHLDGFADGSEIDTIGGLVQFDVVFVSACLRCGGTTYSFIGSQNGRSLSLAVLDHSCYPREMPNGRHMPIRGHLLDDACPLYDTPHAKTKL